MRFTNKHINLVHVTTGNTFLSVKFRYEVIIVYNTFAKIGSIK